MGRTAVFLGNILLTFISVKGQVGNSGNFVPADSVEYIYEYDTITLEADTLLRVDTVFQYLNIKKKKIRPFSFKYNYSKQRYYWFEGLRWSAEVTGGAAQSPNLRNLLLHDSVSLQSDSYPLRFGSNLAFQIHLENIYYGIEVGYQRRQSAYVANWHDTYSTYNNFSFGSTVNLFIDSIDQKITIRYINTYDFIPVSVRCGYLLKAGNIDLSALASYTWYAPLKISFYDFGENLIRPKEVNKLYGYYSGISAQIGISYALFRKLAIALNLTLGKDFGATQPDKSLNNYYYGLHAGFRYYFFLR